MVICHNGSPLALSEGQDNYFIHSMDPFVVDEATNHIVYEGQKPLGLFVKLVQLYSCEGDWIYYAPSGVGKYLLICIYCTYGYMDNSIVGMCMCEIGIALSISLPHLILLQPSILKFEFLSHWSEPERSLQPVKLFLKNFFFNMGIGVHVLPVSA